MKTFADDGLKAKRTDLPQQPRLDGIIGIAVGRVRPLVTQNRPQPGDSTIGLEFALHMRRRHHAHRPYCPQQQQQAKQQQPPPGFHSIQLRHSHPGPRCGSPMQPMLQPASGKRQRKKTPCDTSKGRICPIACQNRPAVQMAAKKKARPFPAAPSFGHPGFQAVTACRRRIAAPTSPKPAISMAQVAGSGTPGITGVLAFTTTLSICIFFVVDI